MKRALAILLALVMMIGLFAGCSNDAKTDDSSSTSSSSSASDKKEDTKKEDTKTEDKKEEEKKEEASSDLPEGKRIIESKHGTYTFNEEGFPVTDEPSTFSVIIGSSLLSFDDSIHMTNVSEATNVWPEWTFIPSSSTSERKALVYASGEYPDVMGSRMVSKADTIQYGPTGILMNVKPLLKQYATWFNKLLTDDLWAQIECYDGNIYFLPTFYANLGGTANGLGDGVMAQPSGWYEKLGISEPKNVDDLYNNLVAIRDNDANGNGDATDEIPLLIMPLSANPLDAIPNMANWFGEYGDWWVDDNGTVIDGKFSEANKEAIKFVQKLYQEGLIMTESFSTDVATARAIGNTEDGVYGYIFGYSPHYYSNDALVYNVYTMMGPLEDQNGVKRYTYENDASSGISYQWAITNACDAPEIVVRYCDYLWDPLVTMQTNDGPLGVRFAYEGDKLIRYDDTTHPDKIPAGYDSFGAFTAADRDQQIPRFYGPLVQETLKNEYGYETQLSVYNQTCYDFYDLVDPYKVQGVPLTTPTAEENEKTTLYTTDIDKIYNETVTAWIVNNGDVDAGWDSLVEQMKAFGRDEITAIKQAQTDRYFAALGQ